MRCSLSFALTFLVLVSAVAIVAAGDGGGDGGDGEKKCGSSHYTVDGVCTPCPDNSWAPKGSDSVEDCICWNNFAKQADGSCELIEDVDGGWCPLSECSASCGCGVQTRVCACPAPSGEGKGCEGKEHVPCVRDACVHTAVCPTSTYSPTGSYVPGQSECTACPAFSWAPAGSTDITDCSCWVGYEGENGGVCTPVVANVNGGWCPVSECSATCGGGTQNRTCDCPAPSGNGAQCEGATVIECAMCACEVEGVPCPESTYSATGKYISNVSECSACPASTWSPVGSDSISDCECWSGYTGAAGGPCTEIIPNVNGGWCPMTVCNATCDGGVQHRTCACPPRSGDGADCEGEATVACGTEPCVQPCPESYYSSTGTWDCRHQQRCKRCPRYSWSPAGSDSKHDCVCWAGYERDDKGKCKRVHVPPHVNGGWCPASECSATCGGGVQHRECACPAPEGSGAACKGEATVACNECACADVSPAAVPCPESTYSSNGMYTPGVSHCTACPAYSWSPSGSNDISDCECWCGYTGAAGGPCTVIEEDIAGGWCPFAACNTTCGGGVQSRTCGCPAPSGSGAWCEGSDEESCNMHECRGTQPSDVRCSAAADEAECSGWEGCTAVSGYECRTGEWCTYLGCTESSVASQVQTCAVHTESGERAWFATSLLPDGYLTTTPMGDVQSCCAPESCNSTRPAKGGCTYELGGGCVVMQFRGECPVDVSGAVAWMTSFVTELAQQLDTSEYVQYAGVAQALLSSYIHVVAGPSPNNGTNTYSTTIQIAPASVTVPYTPEQVVALIMHVQHSGNLSATQVASQLQGVAAFASFTADSVVVKTDVDTSAADGFAHASLKLVLVTGIVGTIIAKIASFMQ